MEDERAPYNHPSPPVSRPPYDGETPMEMVNRLVALSTDGGLSARDRRAIRFALHLLDKMARKMEGEADAGSSPG